MNKKRSEAQICFHDWCAKVYDENAEVVNGLAFVAGIIILASVISKFLEK